MKKIAVVILAFLYIITTTGANINLHYCMGELADWGLGSNESKTCGFCGMEKGDEKDNGCCKDELKFIKNDNDQKFVESATYTLKIPAVALLPVYTAFTCIQSASVKEQNAVSHAPPRYKGLPFYISNRTFLI
jgi:hypothetical protein